MTAFGKKTGFKPLCHPNLFNEKIEYHLILGSFIRGELHDILHPFARVKPDVSIFCLRI